MSSYGVFLPEAILVATALASAVLGFAWRKRPDLLWAFSVIGTGLAIFVTLDMMGLGIGRALNLSVWPSPVGKEGDFAVELKMRVDTFALFFQLMFQFVAFLAIVASRGFIHADEPHQGEYYALMLLAVVGMMFTAAATDLFVLFLAFETSSLSTFALVAFRKKDKQATEAAVKFFIIGAVSSGIILFGISLIYGIAGTTSIGTTTTDLLVLRNGLTLAGHPEIEPPLIIALVLLIAGFGFKVAVVPFHMWAPDVYQGSPTTISVLLTSASKNVGIVALFRVFLIGLLSVQVDWVATLAILAIVTQTVGNVVAIPQRSIKRMLAYSSIAQAGYILIALAVGAIALQSNPPHRDNAAYVAAFGLVGGMLHVFVYGAMKAGSFLVVAGTESRGIPDDIEAYKGLSRRMPFMAFSMLVFLLSLAPEQRPVPVLLRAGDLVHVHPRAGGRYRQGARRSVDQRGGVRRPVDCHADGRHRGVLLRLPDRRGALVLRILSATGPGSRPTPLRRLLSPTPTMRRRMASPSPGSRVILHVDMDAFYASVEVRENPALEGKPVVVGADPREHPRGVVLTASYEARQYGVRSAMSCIEASRRCPQAVFVPPHFELYGRVSGEIMDTLRTFADRLQPSGIEEGFLDVTIRTGGSFAHAQDLAREIKVAIRERHRLTCSIGVAPTKAIAKIASDLQKPDGLTIVSPDEVVAFLAPISVRKILGVGPKTAERLKEIGLESIAEVQGYNRQDLIELLGAFGEYLHDVSMGRDAEEVVEPTGPPESISTEMTFEKDLGAYADVWPELEVMAKSLHDQIVHEKYAYRTVTLKAKYSNFEIHTRSKSLKIHSTDLEPILILTQTMLKEVLASGRKIRLVGVRLSNLLERAAPQTTLSKWTPIREPVTDS